MFRRNIICIFASKYKQPKNNQIMTNLEIILEQLSRLKEQGQLTKSEDEYVSQFSGWREKRLLKTIKPPQYAALRNILNKY